MESDGFVQRTGPVLFARFTNDTAYFLAVLPHNNWTRQELVRIIHQNWPDAISRYRRSGVDLEWIPTDDEVRKLRKHGILSIVQVEPGVIYMPIGGGYATSRLSIVVGTSCDRIIASLHALEDGIREMAPKFVAEAHRHGLAIGEELSFRLRRESIGYTVTEEHTNLQLRLSS